MKFQHSAALLIAATILSLPGCGKRDREEAKKASDGSDTFVYVKPDLKKYAKKAPPPEVASDASATAIPESQKKTGSVTAPTDRGNE